MLSLILIITAFVLFILAAFAIASGKINLVAAGLACWVASSILSRYSL